MLLYYFPNIRIYKISVENVINFYAQGTYWECKKKNDLFKVPTRIHLPSNKLLRPETTTESSSTQKVVHGGGGKEKVNKHHCFK